MKIGSQTGKQQVIPLSPGGHLLSGGLALSFGVPGIEGKLGEAFLLKLQARQEGPLIPLPFEIMIKILDNKTTTTTHTHTKVKASKGLNKVS